MEIPVGKAVSSSVAAVLETLGDEQNVRVALLLPHTARKLVKESVNSGGSGILSNLTDSILVDLPFRNLLYESRKVQRLYYELDKTDTELYGKSNPPANFMLLVDPIRLSHHLKLDMNQAQRSLFMRCFSPKIWLIFLRLVSLGVGSKMRDLYSAKYKKTTSDFFLRDIENFQLGLVEMVFKVMTVDPGVHTPSDIENVLLNWCKSLYGLAKQIRDSWSGYLDEMPLLTELIPYLNKCVAHINALLVSSGAQLSDEGTDPSPDFKIDPDSVKVFFDDQLPVSSTGSKGFDLLAHLSEGDDFSLAQVSSDTNGNDSYGPIYLRDLDPNPLNIPSTNGNSQLPNHPNFMKIIEDLRKAIVSVATKSATLISLMKLQILERRQRDFETPGSFGFISNEVLRKGFLSSGLDAGEALPLVLLAHCLGAYSVREWAMRFLVDAKLDEVGPFLDDASPLSVNSYGFNESPYFRTAGQTVPTLGDFFTLVPPELKAYMRRLSAPS